MSRLDRVTVILFAIVMVNAVTVRTVGYSLLGGDLFTLFLVIALALAAVRRLASNARAKIKI